jgi:SHS2 domain-containing protein
MKWVLVDKFDNIVHTVDLNAEYSDEEAEKYFVNLKQIPYENFIQLWKVMTEEGYQLQLKLSLKNRQVEWWNDDNYLDIDR